MPPANIKIQSSSADPNISTPLRGNPLLRDALIAMDLKSTRMALQVHPGSFGVSETEDALAFALAQHHTSIQSFRASTRVSQQTQTRMVEQNSPLLVWLIQNGAPLRHSTLLFGRALMKKWAT